MNGAPDPERTAAGWERRFDVDVSRAPEMARLYEQLGFETALEPVRAEATDPGCGECPLVTLGRIVTLYTRRRGAPVGP